MTLRIRPGRPARLLLLFAAATWGDAAAAQEAGGEPGPGESRPKVVLVLSGGGARGAAHVGVLKRLEEMRVPVDLVIGTSMGSIVGSMYAAGYTPDEMARLLDETDWPAVLSDKPPRDRLWFRRRGDDLFFQVDLEMGWDQGLTMPPGAIVGTSVEAFLEQVLLPVLPVSDFDALPIPFRCVATDAVRGERYVFDRGPLPLAVRASLSLPGVFAPVEWDGRTLVDGGVLDNLPVQLAKDLGADVILAVDISGRPGDAEALKTAAGGFNQMLRILTLRDREAARDSVRPQDLLLQPDVSDIGLLEFSRSEEAIAIGYRAMQEQSQWLAALSLDAGAWERWRGEVLARRPPPVVPREVRIEGDTGLAPEVLERLSRVEPGVPLDADALRETRERFAGLGIIEHVFVDVVPAQDAGGEGPRRRDEVDVVVRPVEKRWGPHYFRFGFDMSTDLEGEGEFGVGMQHTWTPVNAYGGEWRTEVNVGTRGGFLSEYYQPLDPGLRWFAGPYVGYVYESAPIFLGGEPAASYDLDYYEGGLFLGRNLGDWGEARVRWSGGRLSAEPRVFPPGLPRETLRSDLYALEATLTLDTLDRTILPEHGAWGQLVWTASSAEADMTDTSTTAEAALLAPFTVGRFTMIGSAAVGTTVDPVGNIGEGFGLGGFRRLSGLAPNALAGNHYGLLVLQAWVRLGERTTDFELAPFVGATLEAGNVWDERSQAGFDDLLYAGSLFVGADSFVGQGYFGIGLTEGGETALYVFVGPIF